MSDKKTFQELFSEAVSLRGLNLERLSEMSGISRDYLAAFISGDFKKTPSLPYARGYLMRIAEILGINGDYLWSVYREEIADIKKSDRLPINRFAPKRKNRKIISIAIILFFVIIYLAFKIDDLLGIPEIKINRPANSGEITNEQFIKINGIVSDFFDKLTINNEEIPVEKNGEFEKEYQLQSGVNKIEFKVKRFLGKEIKVEREIIYQL
jgi:transcriptional regulator with XRE-family HTH domain